MSEPAERRKQGPPDTAYVCVVDSMGNAFSGTPSDGCTEAPVVPGTGLTVSPRGLQSWTDPLVPSVLAPGKRPRLTPNPSLVAWQSGDVMPFGTPGGDTMVQAMAQVLLNMMVFGQLPQDAVDAPRFISHSFPSSVEPHAYEPGRLSLEAEIGTAVGDELVRRGHRVDWLPDWSPATAGVCCVRRQAEILEGATDPRRAGSVIGW